MQLNCLQCLKSIYRTRAINNRGLNSGKTFWVIVRGYYSREVTIQEKLFSTTLFHRNFYKNFQKTLGFLSLDFRILINFTLHEFLFHVLGFCSRKKKSKVSNESLSETHASQHLPKDVVPKLKSLVNEYIIDRNCLTQPILVLLKRYRPVHPNLENQKFMFVF